MRRLCSVLFQAMARVVKPASQGGRVLLLEHARSDNPVLGAYQVGARRAAVHYTGTAAVIELRGASQGRGRLALSFGMVPGEPASLVLT